MESKNKKGMESKRIAGVSRAGEEFVVFPLRLPETMYGRLKAVAVEECRSVNSAVNIAVQRYVKSFEGK